MGTQVVAGQPVVTLGAVAGELDPTGAAAHQPAQQERVGLGPTGLNTALSRAARSTASKVSSPR